MPLPGRPSCTSHMRKARPRVKWHGQRAELPRLCLHWLHQGLDGRPPLSKLYCLRTQGSGRMGQRGPRVATAAHSSTSWETEIPEWACHGLDTSQTLFLSVVHPTSTLQIKELKVSGVLMLLASEYLHPSTIPQYFRERGLRAGIWCCVNLGKSPLLSDSGIYISGSRGSELGLWTLVLGLTPEKAGSRCLPTPTERWILVQILCLGVKERKETPGPILRPSFSSPGAFFTQFQF